MPASASEVRAASARLRAAGAALRARPRAEIVRVLGTLLERLRDPASAIRARLAAELPAATGFHPATLAAGLDLGFEPWTAEALAALVARELGGDPSRIASGFPLTAVVLGGAIPMPSVLQGIAPLALGSPVLVRTGAHDPVTARAVAHELARLDPELGACVEVVSFPHGDAEAMAALCEAECVVATGSDAAVASIRARTQPWQRFVGYGHRFSVAAIGREGDLVEACGAVAVDTALWDQLGCLSPIALFAVGWPWDERAALLGELARAFANRAAAWPLGRLTPEDAARRANEIATFELRAASSGEAELRRDAGNAWALLAERESVFRGSPLGRALRVLFIPDLSALEATLAPVARHLASAGVAGFTRTAAAEVGQRLAALGASRICPAGSMQAPPISWCHDGQGVLATLARLGSVEI
ncbi:MAG: hypothetical protein FJ091_16690 [Deltaproteobacteria bacterium]|nr:hypothetical protein [Deltaproteobacteria bacterium]